MNNLTDISAHETWFQDYAQAEQAKENGDRLPLQLKRQHTVEVLANARQIVINEQFNPTLSRACLLAALYHDVGRFEQYLQFHTFKDRDSVNHGRYGVKILKKEKRLKQEKPEIAYLVFTAVAFHNSFALPSTLSSEKQLVTNVVRDADKLDILRIMDQHLSGSKPYNPSVILNLPDDPNLYSETVIQATLQERIASYNDLCSVNDFKLLLGTWLFDMHFQSSKQRFLTAGHAYKLVHSLPSQSPYSEARKKLLAYY